jgi:hypothetical protein
VGPRRQLVGQRVPGRAVQGVELLGVARDERHAREQIGADALQQVRLDRGTQVDLARQQRQDDQPEGSREQLAADPQPHGSSSLLLPTADA